MFLVMFVLPQILVLGDRIVEKTSFQVKLPATPMAVSGGGFPVLWTRRSMA